MQRIRTVAAVAPLVVSVLLLAACSAPEPEPAAAPSPVVTTPAPDPLGDGILRIGTLLPRTGTLSYLGPALVAGVDVAIRELNEAGGIGGVPVEIVHGDSGDAAADTAEKSLATLLEKGVDVVIGPSSSVIAFRLLPTLEEAGIPMISPAATLPELTGVSDHFFRTIPAYPLQGRALAAAILAEGPAKVAIIHSADMSGRLLAATLDEAVQERGGTMVAVREVDAAATDHTALVASVKDEAPDAVVLATQGGQTPQTRALITSLTSAGLGGAALWLTSQNLADYSQALNAGVLDKVNGVLPGVQPDAEFITRLKRENSALELYEYAVEAYDAVIIAALAALLANDDAGTAITATLPSVTRGGITCLGFAECSEVLATDDDIDYGGASGPLNWNTEGDVTSAYYGVYRYSATNKYSRVASIFAGE